MMNDEIPGWHANISNISSSLYHPGRTCITILKHSNKTEKATSSLPASVNPTTARRLQALSHNLRQRVVVGPWVLFFQKWIAACCSG